MIHVERARTPAPLYLSSDAALEERRSAEEYFRDVELNRQSRFEFLAYRVPEVGFGLRDLFYSKCAYCERRVESDGVVDMYRPLMGLAERPEHPGYWWLSTEWTNMLLSCDECSSGSDRPRSRTDRGNRFPLIDEGTRAFSPGKEDNESPLLLDPCRDEPEGHLVFDAKGTVASATRRGQTSISLLSLNRPNLVRQRFAAAEVLSPLLAEARELARFAEPSSVTKRRRRSRGTIEGALDRRRSASERDAMARLGAELRRVTAANEEFAGFKRQLVRPVLEGLAELVTLRADEIVASTPTLSTSRKATVKRAFTAYQAEQSDFSLSTETGRETFRSERRLIERVEIKKVKAIRHLVLDVPAGGAGPTPWIMLLGENGTGKSTVLQAIALTLIGPGGFLRLSGQLGLRPSDFVRYRCKTGSVGVQLSGFRRPHRLTFHRDRAEFVNPAGQRSTVFFEGLTPQLEGEGFEPQLVLLAYGATRLLPREERVPETAPGDSYSRVENLFDPFRPLSDAEGWLASRPPLEFGTAALVLKDLLSLGAKARLLVEDGHVFAREHGVKVPLQRLSDGYQSVIATAIDVLEVLSRLWPNLLDAEGIVLLDEIGAHLHPTWKMRIVSSLRRAFPGVQFLTSTHDPLCLRGLGAGEAVVMRRGEWGQLETLVDLPSPGDFRVDQLLTSDFFGLSSTDDPETEQLFDQYYALMALATRDEKQEATLKQLREQLHGRGQLGSTLRESLMYEAVDRIVARQRAQPTQVAGEIRQEAVAAVSSIWDQGSLGGEGQELA